MATTRTSETFPWRLRKILQTHAEGGSSTEESSLRLREGLVVWNDSLESILFGKPEEAPVPVMSPSSDEDDCIDEASQGLQRLLLQRLDQSNMIDVSTDELESTQVVLDQWRDGERSATWIGQASMASEILRTAKNFLRWYLQLHLFSTATATSRISNESTVLTRWQSHDMLELYLILLSATVEHSPDTTRTIAQLLFYATYDTNPVQGANDAMQQTYSYLIHDLNLLTVMLQVLVATPRHHAAALQLALVRNVHNLLATYAPAKEAVETTRVDGDTSTSISYHTVLLDLLMADNESESSALPVGDHDDEYLQRRAELTLEVLRTLYALRVGRDLDHNDRLAHCLLQLLRTAVSTTATDHAAQTTASNTDIALATVSVIMDAPPAFADYILEHHAVNPLLALLNRQVTWIIDNKRADERGAAAVLPVLVTVHQFVQANTEFCTAIRDVVFPVENKANFERLVQEARQRDGSKNSMVPLDAPKGTFRFKLIALLTWPQANVKRFAGELLWSLCGNDPTEFTLRVGMGNALPFLGAKGVVDMPSQVFS